MLFLIIFVLSLICLFISFFVNHSQEFISSVVLLLIYIGIKNYFFTEDNSKSTKKITKPVDKSIKK